MTRRWLHFQSIDVSRISEEMGAITAVFESVGVRSRRTDWPLGRNNEALNGNRLHNAGEMCGERRRRGGIWRRSPDESRVVEF
jgi:hypothetical protein